jgi:ribose transport system substrate-binding protein
MNPFKLAQGALKMVVGVILLVGINACSDGERSESQASREPLVQQEAPESIALVMKTLTNPFFIEMEKGARRAEQELGITLLVKTAAQETSIQQQIEIVHNLIREEVDAIVIAPGDSVELIPVLKSAQDSGIVVVNIDNQLDPEYARASALKPVPFISVDNEQGAYDSASAIVSKLQKPTQVGILEGIRGAKNAEDRKNGALRAFAESPLAEVVAMETANWKIDEGFAVTKKLLTENPRIAALFCANDMMALGAIQYLQSMGRTEVLVAAYDALEEAQAEIKKGTLVSTIDQQAAEQGFLGVLTAHRILAGESVPSIVLVDTRLITQDNL